MMAVFRGCWLELEKRSSSWSFYDDVQQVGQHRQDEDAGTI